MGRWVSGLETLQGKCHYNNIRVCIVLYCIVGRRYWVESVWVGGFHGGLGGFG